jgi:FMN phosphatase YigB (HAD superfamily)
VKPIAAVLFDFFDTLFWRDVPTRVVSVASASGVVVDLAHVRRITAEVLAAAKTPEELSKGRDLSMAAHRACWTHLYEPFDVLAPELDPRLSTQIYDDATTGEAFNPFPDTIRCIDTLTALNVPMGVVSDIGWDVRRPFMSHGIADRFKVFVPSFAHGCEKPDRRLFQAACDILEVSFDEVLMVGDNVDRDGGAARHGMRTYILPPWIGQGDRGLMAVPAIVAAFRI